MTRAPIPAVAIDPGASEAALIYLPVGFRSEDRSARCSRTLAWTCHRTRLP